MLKNKTGKNKFAVAIISVAVLAGANSAFAAGFDGDSGSGTTTHESGIISALVAKFGLAKTDVEAVFKNFHDSERATMESKRAGDEKERLAGAVALGTLTQTQADSITAKQAAVKASIDALMGDTSKSGADRRTAMKTIADDTSAWAKANNIPEKYIRAGGRGSMRGNMHARGMHGRGFEK